MPSLVPGFEYDIFISYRQNDNRSGWVTEFVRNLEEELASTIKEPVSAYFDTNPHDGLLENHDVDKSIESKLNALIFIPIISQTYCDPKSFAWQNELLAFNMASKADVYGLNIKLANGYVASRILPVRIHDLDAEDKALIENKLGSALRSIEFIFKSAGVNRPLTPTDNPDKNVNKTFYRDQINKVANAIKEIVGGIKSTGNVKVKPTEPSYRLHEPRLKSRTRKLLSNSSLVLLLMLLAGYFIFNFTSFSDSLRPQAIEKSVAVLPFTNLSKDEEQEYFSDGLTEDIITQLAKIKTLKVISRTSVMLYKKNPKPVKVMAEELGVAAILEGSVQRAGDQVRITAQLINAATDEHLWAESYDRPIKDLFDVQSDVAKQIAIALKTTLSPSEKSYIEKAPTTNLGAYNLYLKAHYRTGNNSKEGYSQSIAFLKEAIQLDSGFALAYASLANGYSLIAYYQYDLLELKEAWRLARKNAVKAFDLDSTSAESYDALAYILRTHDWNWTKAEEKWKKAIALNPNYGPAPSRYTLLLGLEGRFEESFVQAQRGLELDPLNLSTIVDKARMHYYAGQHDEAIRIAKTSFQLEKNYRPALGLIGCVLEQKGLMDSSVVMISGSASRTGTDYEGVNERFESKPANYEAYWKSVLDRTIQDAKTQRISSIIMAVLYTRTKNYNEALSALEKAYEDREGGLVYANVEPLFKPLRADPRFKKIMDNMGLIK